MTTQPQVAVVLLNYNGKHWLQRFLGNVMATDYPALEVVVADNASTDGSVEWLRKEYPGVSVIEMKENAGYAGGYNQALREVEAECFVLLNTDVLVEPDWLKPLIAGMERDAQIGAAQPCIRSYEHRELFEYAGAAGGWIDVVGYPFARGRVFDRIEADLGQYKDEVDVFWASGACLCLRRSAWEASGGFDAVFFAHQEEIDLCWRLQLLGYRIVAIGGSQVFHVGGGTLPVGGRKVMLNFRNNLIMLSRNLLFWERLWVLPVRWLLDVVAAWRALLLGRGGEFFAIARAHFAVIGWWFGGKKRVVVGRRPLRSLRGVYGGLLIWDFYVRGRKVFSEIIGGGSK